MYVLENGELTVSILDPQTDLDRCGSRYCVGGYIYQVEDAVHGTLFTGPQWPKPYPDVFDGQGAPDMFATPLGAEDAPVGGEVGIIGVGRVRRTSPIEPFSVRHNPEVIEFLPWTVEEQPHRITMRTEGTFRGWSYRLARHITLTGRSIDSRTEIESTGDAPLPVRWFPHPFYPPTVDGLLCRFSMPVTLGENPGYFMNAEGWICQRPDFDWGRGCFLAVDFTREGNALTVTQRHPVLGDITAQTDYAPVYLPIWGNSNTFSFEPYFEKQLNRGDSASWGIVYHC
jgi:hypothetical protein